jgi:uncharacterized protein with GYD domain
MFPKDIDEGKRDTYFGLWTVTPEGHRDIDRFRQTIETASSTMARVGGECHLFLASGGSYDMIAMIKGVDEELFIAMLHALKSSGVVAINVLKTKEYSLGQIQKHFGAIKDFQAVGPSPQTRRARGRRAGQR